MSAPQRLELPWREPIAVARQLDGDDGLIWLDGDGSYLGRWVILASQPLEVIHCRGLPGDCLLYTSPSPRDGLLSRMPSSA